MSQCPQCGTPTQPGQSFCGICGTNLVTAESEQTVVRPSVPPQAVPPQAVPPQATAQFPVTPQQPWGAPPPAQPWGAPPPPQGQPPYGQPTRTGPDLTALLRGNWAAALVTAGIALGTAFGFGLVVAFAGAEDLDVASAIWTTLLLTLSAFGADTQVALGETFGADDATSSIGQYPLLATVLALGAAAYYFRTATARYTRLKDYLLDAVRAAGALAVLVFLLSIVVEIASPEIEGYTSLAASNGKDVYGLLLLDGESTASVGGALFLPLLLLLLVLAALAVTRRDLWTGKVAAVPGWLAAPLAGYAAVLGGLTVAGLLWTVAQLAGEEDARGLAEVVRLLAVLPAAGLHLLNLGSLGKIGESSDGDDRENSNWDRLWDYADDHGALFWIAPVAAVAIAALGVWAVVRRTAERPRVLRNVGVYLGGLVVFLPLVVRLANAHVSFDAEADGESVESDAVFGTDGFQAWLLFLLLSLVVAALVLLLTGNLDVDQVRSRASAFAQSVQTNPGQRPPQQWGQQPPPPQWGQQPPPPPPWGQQPPPPPPSWQPPQQ